MGKYRSKLARTYIGIRADASNLDVVGAVRYPWKTSLANYHILDSNLQRHSHGQH